MSDSVTLDLLTYADLELLRNRKAGVVSRPRGNQQSSALTAKRYLILIYTVEFDRFVSLWQGFHGHIFNTFCLTMPSLGHRFSFSVFSYVSGNNY